MTIRRTRPGLALLASLLMIGLVASPLVAQDTRTVKVTVKYTGKGTVDPTHKLWIWIFDTPDIGPGAMPVGELSLDTNGAVATFPGVAADQVWVAVAYDEKGGFVGMAPPPSGAPVALLMGSAGPMPVTPGPKGIATVTFDDSQRMP